MDEEKIIPEILIKKHLGIILEVSFIGYDWDSLLDLVNLQLEEY